MKRNCGTVLLILLAALASGCALQPTYERPAAPVADAFPAGAAYRAAQNGPAGSTPAAPDIGWRAFLRDPPLPRFGEIAPAQNPRPRGGELNLGQGAREIRVPRSPP